MLPTRRRALIMLAGSPDGVTEPVLLAHGFTTELLAALINAGLATAHADQVRAGGREITVTRVKISDVGRKALP